MAAFMTATGQGNAQLVQLLLHKGVSPNSCNSTGGSSLGISSPFRDPEIMVALLAHDQTQACAAMGIGFRQKGDQHSNNELLPGRKQISVYVLPLMLALTSTYSSSYPCV